MQDILTCIKALADQNRVRALLALRGRELCACQLIELLGLAPSTVSKHMSILKQAGLVEARKVGRWMYYRLPDEHAPAAGQEVIAWVCRHVARAPQIREDTRCLGNILTWDPEELCRKHAKK